MMMAKKLLLTRLAQLKLGRLRVHEGTQQMDFGATQEMSADVEIHHPDFYRAMVWGGSLGAAESYVLGHWDTPDLTELLRLMLRNERQNIKLDNFFSHATKWVHWLQHQLKKNNLQGSRRNIAKHYDLSNDFFKLFLDDAMMYSSAVFPNDASTLKEASQYKLDMICQKLRLSAGDKILEIGTGWGGFAMHAATHYGCHVVTTTISKQQHQWAQSRIEALGLSDKITLLQQDYRHLTGIYDKIVSIEMIEAVGHQYYRQFFSKCASLLTPEGSLFLQAITLQDQMYERAKHDVDFIKKYIFPGSCIPSVTALQQAMTKSSDLRLYQAEDIGLHYVRTLACWRENFVAQKQAILKLGFDEAFIRMWLFYFSYCEAGFAEGYLGNMHLHYVKPLAIRC